jgi:uncharacterized protein (DUF2237 family)
MSAEEGEKAGHAADAAHAGGCRSRGVPESSSASPRTVPPHRPAVSFCAVAARWRRRRQAPGPTCSLVSRLSSSTLPFSA